MQMAATDDKKLLTLADLKRQYGVGRTYGYKLIRNGDLEAVKVGSKTMITLEAAEKWRRSLPRLNLSTSSKRRG
jgi:excisionase family DNA binding protein